MKFRLQEELKLLLIFRNKYHYKHHHHYHSTTISLFLKLFTFSRLSSHHYPFHVCFIGLLTVYPKTPMIVQVLSSISRQQFQEFRCSGLCIGTRSEQKNGKSWEGVWYCYFPGINNCSELISVWSRGSSIGIATSHWLDNRIWFRYLARSNISLLATAREPVLWPTQPLTPWIPLVPFLEVTCETESSP
jgi:hypothetical protein